MPRSPSGRLPSRPWARVRRAALDRDEWRCCRCGSPLDLEVHHKRPVAVAPSLAFVLANVETVCRECHLGEHLDPERRAWRRLLREPCGE